MPFPFKIVKKYKRFVFFQSQNVCASFFTFFGTPPKGPVGGSPWGGGVP